MKHFYCRVYYFWTRDFLCDSSDPAIQNFKMPGSILYVFKTIIFNLIELMGLQPLYELCLKFTLVSLQRQYVSTKLKRTWRAKVDIHIEIPH